MVLFSISAVNAQDSTDFQANQLPLDKFNQASEMGSFTELNDKIATYGNFTLEKDYTYTPDDSDYKDGIKITWDNIVIDGNGYTIDGAGQARIFHIMSNNVTLKNINFVNGYSSANGGAIYVENDFSNSKIESTFINNSANAGGAIYFAKAVSNVSVIGYFENNEAERTGGAIGVGGESIDNTFVCDFYNNRAKAASGGAIFFRNLVENNQFESIFRYNSAAYGAGIFFYNKANNNKFNSDFSFNVALSCGGAMFFHNTTNNNNFSGYFVNNSALGKVDPENGNGGAITFKDTSCNSIFNCDFVNNTAALYGGGVNYRQTPHNITFNSNFINNDAKYGGGVNFFESFENVVFNGVFIGNHAFNGGAICIGNDFSNSKIESIFINNSANAGGAIFFSGAVTNVSVIGYFENNEAERTGGAINVNGKSIGNTFVCDFYNNRAKAASGGAIFFRNLVENNQFESIFRYNSAAYGAGIFFYNKANNNKFNSDFSFNVALSCGGAMFFHNTTNNNNFSGYFVNNSALGKVDPENGNGGAITFKDTSCNSIFNCDFVNNTAALYGGGVNYRQTPHNITFNSNFINNGAECGGGVNFFESLENVVFNGLFIGNHADYGGAIAAKNGVIENTSFFNNYATEEGGAICFDDDGEVNNCEFYGNSATSYGGAICFNGEGTAYNCNFTNNEAGYFGGAVYIWKNGKILNSNFDNNSAQNGGAVYVHGIGEIDNCNFVDNDARTGGAIEFWESGTVANSNFNYNVASFSGGAIYSSGDLKISDSVFNSNSALDYAGGAVFVLSKGEIIHCDFNGNFAYRAGAVNLRGNDGIISESTFSNNFAEEDGGAIHLDGSNANFNNVNFTGNIATKGSAIYKVADAINFNIANVIFDSNRANTSDIRIEVEGNESYAPNNTVVVHVYLVGNDNIANAIWNGGETDTIKLENVFSVFSQDGDGRINSFKFNDNILESPTDGYADSSILWQSPQEDAQLLDILITNEDGSVVLYNLTDGIVHKNNTKKPNLLMLSDDSDIKVTDVYGAITVELENLPAGKYNIKSKHVGDEYYTEWANDSSFVIYDVSYDVILNVTVTADAVVTYNNTLVNFTVTVMNVGLDNASEVIITDSLPDTLIYSNWGIINSNGANITSKAINNGVELNISNITAGNFVSIWIEALTNGVGVFTNEVTVYCKENDTIVNGSATVIVIPADVPPVDPGNDTPVKPDDAEKKRAGIEKNSESTGNPILALLVALSVLGISTKRRK